MCVCVFWDYMLVANLVGNSGGGGDGHGDDGIVVVMVVAIATEKS